MSFDELYEQMDEKGANRYPVGKLIRQSAIRSLEIGRAHV